MAQFVRNDALQLVDVICRDDEAGLDVDGLAAGHEGIDLGVVQQDDVGRLVEARRADQRL